MAADTILSSSIFNWRFPHFCAAFRHGNIRRWSQSQCIGGLPRRAKKSPFSRIQSNCTLFSRRTQTTHTVFCCCFCFHINILIVFVSRHRFEEQVHGQVNNGRGSRTKSIRYLLCYTSQCILKRINYVFVWIEYSLSRLARTARRLIFLFFVFFSASNCTPRYKTIFEPNERGIKNDEKPDGVCVACKSNAPLLLFPIRQRFCCF